MNSDVMADAIAASMGVGPATEELRKLSRSVLGELVARGLASTGVGMAERLKAENRAEGPTPPVSIQMFSGIAIGIVSSPIAYTPAGVGTFTAINGGSMASSGGLAPTPQLVAMCNAIAAYVMVNARVVGPSIVGGDEAESAAQAQIDTAPETGTASPTLEETSPGVFTATSPSFHYFSAVMTWNLVRNVPNRIQAGFSFVRTYAPARLRLMVWLERADGSPRENIAQGLSQEVIGPREGIAVTASIGLEMAAGDRVYTEPRFEVLDFQFLPDNPSGDPSYGPDPGYYSPGPAYTLVTDSIQAT